MKKQLLKTTNAIFASILALFGVSSCNDDVCLYGVPYEEYGCPYSEYIEVAGTVQNETEQPIENIQVVSSGDTVYTDANGYFEMRKSDTYPRDNIRLYFKDIDGTANGSYQNDSADVHITYSEGDGNWNVGVGHGSITKTLREKDE